MPAACARRSRATAPSWSSTVTTTAAASARFPDRAGPVPVIGANAASLRPRPHHAGGSYNLFDIDGEAGAWRVTLRERGMRTDGHVETVSERALEIP